MRKPFFSIIIPTFNQSSFLKKALKSVSKQTFKSFEVIVIDNYSDDDTQRVVKSFKNVIYKKINNYGVISKSRNLGLKISKGKWVAFLDSDDYWDKNKLRTIYEETRKKNFDVICHSEWILNLSSSGKKKIRCYGPFSKNFYKEILLFGNRNSTSASVVKKKFLDKNKLKFDENRTFITSEDYCFFLHIANLDGIFLYLSRPLGYHTFHKGSMSYNYKKHILSKFAVIKYHIFNIQKFNKKKKNLFNHIKKIDKIKNSIISLKKNFIIFNNLKNFFRFLASEPLLTKKYLSIFLKIYIKQKFFQFYY